jgi:hypothetical protein
MITLSPVLYAWFGYARLSTPRLCGCACVRMPSYPGCIGAPCSVKSGHDGSGVFRD